MLTEVSTGIKAIEMKKILSLSFLVISGSLTAQNLIPIPDTLSGTSINLNIHTDSVQFLTGQMTLTNAFNQYSYLGPTIILNKGEAVTMNVTNNLNDTSTVHWHGLHVPAMADGGPHNIILDGGTWSPQFTVMNHASTYWYHPHMHMKTGQQAMRGAAGIIIVRDSIESLLDLPRTYGIDDIPLVIQTQQFDANNQIDWRGMHDSIIMVNGIIDPMVELPAQVVRLRLLNASQERNFNFGFSGNKSFSVIGNDGGLLSSPVSVSRIRLSPGERAEILIDLSTLMGQTLHLMSYASEFPVGVQGGTPMPGMDTAMYSPINGVDFNMLQINVVSTTANLVTTIPASLVTITPWLESASNMSRQLTITALNIMSMDGPFYFNGNLFDMNRIDFQIPLDNIEIWSLTNQTMVAHPFHIHDVQFFVLDRDGIMVQPEEAGFKDVVMIAPQETVRFITKFEDFADPMMPYMFHCHILMHEDDGMMGQFVVLPSSTGISESQDLKQLLAYPIPVNDLLYIRPNSSQNGNLLITDILGQIVFYQENIQDEKSFQINTSQWNNGIYFIKLNNKNGISSNKVLVQH